MGERICSVNGCDQCVLARGWCGMHYSRWRAYGDPGEAARRKMPNHQTCSVADCDREASGKGYCDKHYQRVRLYGDPLILQRPIRDADERFWARVDVGGVCWEWIGFRADGYGRFKDQGQQWSAHRWAYVRLVGPIPEGTELDHLCRNRACVNPDHLEPVVHRENVQRSPIALAAINSWKTHCIRGHELPKDRKCRECGRLKTARYRERLKAAMEAD